jgi:hypothetical protein
MLSTQVKSTDDRIAAGTYSLGYYPVWQPPDGESTDPMLTQALFNSLQDINSEAYKNTFKKEAFGGTVMNRQVREYVEQRRHDLNELGMHFQNDPQIDITRLAVQVAAEIGSGMGLIFLVGAFTAKRNRAVSSVATKS